ncbi:MAG: hypothetical protein ACR2RV_05795 [Verrucomicrobiales bacterium]
MSNLGDTALDRKIRLLEGLAESWTGAGLRWAVCNGLDDYPDGIGRDLDIVLERRDLKDALGITVRYLREAGYTPLPFKLGWLYWVVGLIERDGVVESVQVDLFDHLQWAFSWPVNGVGRFGDTETQGPFVVDPAASIGKRIVINALSNNCRVFEKKPHYLNLGAGEDAVLPDVLRSLSGREEEQMIEAIRAADPAALGAAAQGFRKRVMAHSLLPGRGWGRRMHSALLKQWSMNLFPARSVPTIAVQSSDPQIEGEVCETLGDLISNQLVFCKVITENVRPRVLFKGGISRPWQARLDFFVGERWRDRRRSALQCVQIYRGHALSLHLDPSREGLTDFSVGAATSAPRPQLNAFVSGEKEPVAEQWLGSGLLDLVVKHPETAAEEIFSSLVRQLGSISERQCRRLRL